MLDSRHALLAIQATLASLAGFALAMGRPDVSAYFGEASAIAGIISTVYFEYRNGTEATKGA